jgi:asparagine synthase (glutamine-hydrolysing)
MCGITGFLDLSRSHGIDELTALVRPMMESIQHRGPDDSGLWADAASGVALGFRRLAILDLSPTGHQPMFSADERFVIIFNGEVYNFAELRAELINKGCAFRGTSDTEVMLAAITAWGLETAVQRFNGMFAFALWDKQSHRLYLARDRLGIKPLYYGWFGKILLFGSEPKALHAHPAFHADINRDALTLYLRYGYIPAPHSIYCDVFKLASGTILTIESTGETHQQSYWSLKQAAEEGAANPLKLASSELIDELDSILRGSVRERMIADVPLGAFLSGGIDSSLIVALMQAQSNLPIKTFTIRFREAAFDEARYARAVAQHLRTDHTELYVSPEDALSVIPRLPKLNDEPFADSSQIPTFLVAQLARQHVTVSLSGDGGDELFSGYSRYAWTRQLWQSIGWIPKPIRSTMGKSIDAAARFVLGMSTQTRLNRIMDRAAKLADVIDATSARALYHDFVSFHPQPDAVIQNGHSPATFLTDSTLWPRLPNITEWMMYADMVTYLPDDILVKLDRATMGVSLEGRVPLLDDHRVIEFAWHIPSAMKVHDGQGKWPLRQLLYRYVPRELVDRPKMGFTVPIESWLRGPLRAWAEDLLSAERLRREGFFNPEPVRQKWIEHVSGKRNWPNFLWHVLMFQAWLQEQ